MRHTITIGLFISLLTTLCDAQSPTENKLDAPFWGAKYKPLTKVREIAEELGSRFPRSVDEGAALYMVIPGSPMAKAGFRKNDVVVQIDGDKFEKGKVDQQLQQLSIGKHTLVYYRVEKKSRTRAYWERAKAEITVPTYGEFLKNDLIQRKVDSVENTVTYYVLEDRIQPLNGTDIFAFFQTDSKDQKASKMFLRTQLARDDWIFFRKVIFSCGDLKYEITKDRSEVNTHVGDRGVVFEWCSTPLKKSDFELLKKMSESEDTITVRFVGAEFYYDMEDVSLASIELMADYLELRKREKKPIPF